MRCECSSDVKLVWYVMILNLEDEITVGSNRELTQHELRRYNEGHILVH